MSHTIYHTEALILSRRDYGEANSLYQIFSREFGLITVAAQGTRHLKSKLRGQLAFLGHGHFTLVRGREFWRLIGAEASPRLKALTQNREKFLVATRVGNLFSRLVRGEECQPELFSDLVFGLETLANNEKVIPEISERIIVLRLLFKLGYISSGELLAPWLVVDLWHKTEWHMSESVSRQIIGAINNGLNQSML
mgnify:CR=1 FL=1